MTASIVLSVGEPNSKRPATTSAVLTPRTNNFFQIFHGPKNNISNAAHAYERTGPEPTVSDSKPKPVLVILLDDTPVFTDLGKHSLVKNLRKQKIKVSRRKLPTFKQIGSGNNQCSYLGVGITFIVVQFSDMDKLGLTLGLQTNDKAEEFLKQQLNMSRCAMWRRDVNSTHYACLYNTTGECVFCATLQSCNDATAVWNGSGLAHLLRSAGAVIN